tara:strand:+ start:387 stop:566 length:180 start_codon:yes stop_codon:yes gene_type:complete
METKNDLKVFTKEIIDEFGLDVNYRVKLASGGVFKSTGWDESVRQWRVKNGSQKNHNKR